MYEFTEETLAYIKKDMLEMANFCIVREMKPTARLGIAKYWLGRLEERFPTDEFELDNLLFIKEMVE